MEQPKETLTVRQALEQLVGMDNTPFSYSKSEWDDAFKQAEQALSNTDRPVKSAEEASKFIKNILINYQHNENRSVGRGCNHENYILDGDFEAIVDDLMCYLITKDKEEWKPNPMGFNSYLIENNITVESWDIEKYFEEYKKWLKSFPSKQENSKVTNKKSEGDVWKVGDKIKYIEHIATIEKIKDGQIYGTYEKKINSVALPVVNTKEKLESYGWRKVESIPDVKQEQGNKPIAPSPTDKSLEERVKALDERVENIEKYLVELSEWLTKKYKKLK